MANTPLRDRLVEIVAPVASAAGYDVEDVAVTPAGRRRLLRVVVDRDGGVDLDDVAELSKAVSAALDEHDAMGTQPYVLEVSSPGVDRPLTAPRHWRRSTGRLVRVSLRDGAKVTGRVLAATDDAVTLDAGAGPTALPYAAVARAVVEVEFGRGGDEPAGGEDRTDEEAPA